MASKTFPGEFSFLAKISEFIAEHSKRVGLTEKATYSVQLAVDEACSNIIEHAYGGEGLGDIEVTCKQLEDGLEVIIKDKGLKFDPDEVEDPEIGVPLEELGNRGAGVYLMKKLMDEVHYEYSKNKGTTLRMMKKK